MLAPEKKTHEEKEDLQQYHQKTGNCKKLLRNCCLVKRFFAWKSLSSKGTFPIEIFSVGEIVVFPRILFFFDRGATEFSISHITGTKSLYCLGSIVHRDQKWYSFD